MSAYERWMKRIFKAFIWCLVFFALTWLLDVPATWRTFLVVTICSLADLVLDDAIPTKETDEEIRQERKAAS